MNGTMFGDFIDAGFGFISGDELRDRLGQRAIERENSAKKQALQNEITMVSEEHTAKQNEEWERWLKPSVWYPDPIILDAVVWFDA